MKNFFHVGIGIPAGVSVQSIQEAIDAKVEDWVRYAGNCYIVWTGLNAVELGGVVLSVSGMNGSYFFITKLDPDSFGWLPQWIWDWMHKDRSGAGENLMGLQRLLLMPMDPPKLPGPQK